MRKDILITIYKYSIHCTNAEKILLTKNLTGIENNYNILLLNKFRGMYTLLSTILERKRPISSVNWNKKRSTELAYYFYYWMIINKKINKEKNKNQRAVNIINNLNFIFERIKRTNKFDCFMLMKTSEEKMYNKYNLSVFNSIVKNVIKANKLEAFISLKNYYISKKEVIKESEFITKRTKVNILNILINKIKNIFLLNHFQYLIMNLNQSKKLLTLKNMILFRNIINTTLKYHRKEIMNRFKDLFYIHKHKPRVDYLILTNTALINKLTNTTINKKSKSLKFYKAIKSLFKSAIRIQTNHFIVLLERYYNYWKSLIINEKQSLKEDLLMQVETNVNIIKIRKK
jgi:hypothetical protein